MKYHYLFSLIFLLSATLSIYAQKNDAAPELPSNVKFAWGKPREILKKTQLTNVLASDEQGIYMLRGRTVFLSALGQQLKDYSVELYNNELELLRTAPLSTEETDMTILERVVAVGGQFIVFSSTFDPRTTRKTLFMQTIDKKSMHQNKDKRQIGEVIIKYKPQLNGFTIQFSADSSKMLIASDGGPTYAKDQPRHFSLQVFDSHLKSIWDKKITLPYPEEKITIEGYRVDNNGNVYMSSKLYENTKKGLLGSNPRTKENGLPNYKYMLMAYTNEGTSSEEYAIEPEKFVLGISHGLDQQGNLICGGLYSESSNFYPEGCFSMTIDVRNKKILKKSYLAFSPNSKDDFTAASEFKFSAPVLHTDGGHVLVAEHQLEIVDTDKVLDYYYYRDLIVININPDGNIEWITCIQKYLYLPESYYSAYAMFVFKNKLYFVFNDDERNILKPRKNTPHLLHMNNLAERVAVLAIIDATGNISSSILSYNEKNGVVILPHMACSLSKNTLLLYGQNLGGKKQFRFGKIELE